MNDIEMLTDTEFAEEVLGTLERNLDQPSMLLMACPDDDRDDSALRVELRHRMLNAVDVVFNCNGETYVIRKPHGTPIRFNLTARELLRWFDRP